MKKLFALALALILALSAVAALAENQKIVIGATLTPHALILEQIVDDLKELGYDLEIKVFTDYVLPNEAVAGGDLDANFFQHIPYMNKFNKNASEKEQLVGAIPVHYEPYGLYAGTKTKLEDLQDGDSIAISNDPSNQTRALFLLQAAGLLTLPEGATPEKDYSVLDIKDNPKNLKFVELSPELIPSALQDVAFAVINGNYAIDAGFNPSTDSLFIEPSDGETAKLYGNYIVVRVDNENAPFLDALKKVLHTQKVKDYIENNPDFKGGVIPVFSVSE